MASSKNKTTGGEKVTYDCNNCGNFWVVKTKDGKCENCGSESVRVIHYEDGYHIPCQDANEDWEDNLDVH